MRNQSINGAGGVVTSRATRQNSAKLQITSSQYCPIRYSIAPCRRAVVAYGETGKGGGATRGGGGGGARTQEEEEEEEEGEEEEKDGGSGGSGGRGRKEKWTKMLPLQTRSEITETPTNPKTGRARTDRNETPQLHWIYFL